MYYGGFWRRWLALFIDALLMALILAPVLSLVGLGRHELLHKSGFMAQTIVNLPFLLASGLCLSVWGTTPGKALLGLRVVDADTLGPVSAGQALGRQFAYLISAIVFMLGFVWIGLDARKQGWHDKLAGTLVIRGDDVPPPPPPG